MVTPSSFNRRNEAMQSAAEQIKAGSFDGLASAASGKKINEVRSVRARQDKEGQGVGTGKNARQGCT